MSQDARLREEVRSYYDTVSRYIEVELARRHDQEFWKRTVAGAEHPSILDLGCGTGRISEVLARGASSVVGIDLSREMLRRARQRLAGHAHVHLILADMRSLRLARRFDLVVAANDPFVHLLKDTDRDRALETVADHLESAGGRFVLDAFWLEDDRLEQAARPGGYRRERTLEADEISRPNPLRIRETWHCDQESRRCRVRYEYVPQDDGESGDSSPRDRAVFDARLWSVQELEARLGRVGLRIDSLNGGFDGRPFDPADASHLIVEATPVPA